jgi:hypothetical protein
MFPIAKFVCLVVVFLFVFTTNFDSAMLIKPFDPPTAEAKKKEKKEKKDKKQKKDKGKDEDRIKIGPKIMTREKIKINRKNPPL